MRGFAYGAGGGIRTHGPRRANGFRDRPVMTASILLRGYGRYYNTKTPPVEVIFLIDLYALRLLILVLVAPGVPVDVLIPGEVRIVGACGADGLVA